MTNEFLFVSLGVLLSISISFLSAFESGQSGLLLTFASLEGGGESWLSGRPNFRRILNKSRI